VPFALLSLVLHLLLEPLKPLVLLLLPHLITLFFKQSMLPLIVPELHLSTTVLLMEDVFRLLQPPQNSVAMEALQVIASMPLLVTVLEMPHLQSPKISLMDRVVEQLQELVLIYFNALMLPTPRSGSLPLFFNFRSLSGVCSKKLFFPDIAFE